MAWMNQEKKAIIAAALKKVVPSDWKYSLKVDNHSSIVMTVRSASVDFPQLLVDSFPNGKNQYGDVVTKPGNFEVNQYHYKGKWGEQEALIGQIIDALNSADNYDKSDIMTDYFDVGYYIHLKFGEWNKPFEFVPGARVFKKQVEVA